MLVLLNSNIDQCDLSVSIDRSDGCRLRAVELIVPLPVVELPVTVVELPVTVFGLPLLDVTKVNSISISISFLSVTACFMYCNALFYSSRLGSNHKALLPGAISFSFISISFLSVTACFMYCNALFYSSRLGSNHKALLPGAISFSFIQSGHHDYTMEELYSIPPSNQKFVTTVETTRVRYKVVKRNFMGYGSRIVFIYFISLLVALS